MNTRPSRSLFRKFRLINWLTRKVLLHTYILLRGAAVRKLLDVPDTAWKLEKIERYSDGVPSGYFFTCSAKNCLSLKAKKVSRELTEEEKEALAQRFTASRAEKTTRNQI